MPVPSPARFLVVKNGSNTRRHHVLRSCPAPVSRDDEFQVVRAGGFRSGMGSFALSRSACSVSFRVISMPAGPLVHGLGGVGAEVHQDLLHLYGVSASTEPEAALSSRVRMSMVDGNGWPGSIWITFLDDRYRAREMGFFSGSELAGKGEDLPLTSFLRPLAGFTGPPEVEVFDVRSGAARFLVHQGQFGKARRWRPGCC